MSGTLTDQDKRDLAPWTVGGDVDLANGWTSTGPVVNRNTLNTTDRIPTNAINSLDTKVVNVSNGVAAFGDRFNSVIGDEAITDKDAFDAIGKPLLQAVAEIMETGGGGGISEAPDDGQIYGRKNKDWAEVALDDGSY